MAFAPTAQRRHAVIERRSVRRERTHHPDRLSPVDLAGDDAVDLHLAQLLSEPEPLAALGATVHYGAFRHLVRLIDEHRLERGWVDAYGVLFRRAIDAGCLDDDFAAMTRLMRSPT